MAESSYQQINRYLEDTIAAERNFEKALRSFGEAGEQRQVQQLLSSFSEKARAQHLRLTAILEKRGGSPSEAKTMLAGMLAFTPLSAQVGQSSSEKNTQHLMVTFAAAAAEMAMYETLSAAASQACDHEVLSLAHTLQKEEQEDYKQVWAILRSSAGAAFDSEVANGATPQQLMMKYLEDAIAAEKSFETQLQGLAQETNEITSHSLFEQHARETRTQYEQLTARLEALGGSPSTLKSVLAHVFNSAPKAAQIGHDATERLTQDLMMAFAVENAEVAMYEALAEAARRAGDSTTEQMALAIQKQERSTADKLWRLLAPTARRAVGMAA